MNGPERFQELMERYPPPDRQAAADADAYVIARADWVLGLADQIEAEGERLQRDDATNEAGVWLAKQGRLMRWVFQQGIELDRRDPQAADRFLQEQGLAG